MKKKMPAEKFEMWKKKTTANKPKPKPIDHLIIKRLGW
jgi:hypothetical protein